MKVDDICNVTDVPPGNNCVEETSAPTGFDPDPDIVPVTVGADRRSISRHHPLWILMGTALVLVGLTLSWAPEAVAARRHSPAHAAQRRIRIRRRL